MKWISVEEKLPECDTKWGNSKVVLCIDSKGRIGFCIYVNDKSQLQHKGWFTGGGVGEESRKITHWMPLLKPSEQKTDHQTTVNQYGEHNTCIQNVDKLQL